jgi:fused signal recognition particle receptor
MALGILSRSLGRTRERLQGALQKLLPSEKVDAETLESLEEALIAADVGPAIAAELVGALQESAETDDDPRQVLRETMLRILRSPGDGERPEPETGSGRPWVALLVGVNGSGKTTTTAKLAARYQDQGCSILLGAADTFRAAAVEQLCVWGDRLDVPVVAHQSGGDPAAVVYDACTSGSARGADVILIDTAGRLHTKDNLMAELAKMRRSAGKVIEGAPDEVWLVLDATTGQNGLRQAEDFLAQAGVTGLILAKLDGSARGGVALSIAHRLDLPIRFVGTGEKTFDLEPFDPDAFVDGLLGESS